MIGVSVVHWLMAEHGWTFDPAPGATGDLLYGHSYLHQLYAQAVPRYTGRVTVPVLWDQERQTIVSNESAEIIRMLGSAFDGIGADAGDYYPAPCGPDRRGQRAGLRAVNNGVYRAGFATTQSAYEEAFDELFATLDWLEERLAPQRYLIGDRITEADWRLFTTLLRFDPVYHGHFKCNLRRLVDYPNLWAYTRELYQWPGVAETRRLRAHQGPLLRQPPRPSTRPGSCRRARRSITWHPTAASACWRPEAWVPTCGPVSRSSALPLAGCATNGDLPPRPAVAVPEPAASIDPAQLVGTWTCRDLNPYPDQPEQTVVTTYEAGGAFVSESRTPARGAIGAIIVTARGQWAVADDRLTTSGLRTEARAADGDRQTDLLAKAGAQMVDAMSAAEPDTTEILALDPARLLLRPVGVDDPPVIACTR